MGTAASTTFSVASTFFASKKLVSSNVENQCTSKEATIQAMVTSASANWAEIL